MKYLICLLTILLMLLCIPVSAAYLEITIVSTPQKEGAQCACPKFYWVGEAVSPEFREQLAMALFTAQQGTINCPDVQCHVQVSPVMEKAPQP